MPKIIAEAREKILAYTKKCLFEQGYQAISIRNVAKECKIAVGTIYNYFPDKDTLIASILLEDWLLSLQQMNQECSSITDGILQIYQAIQQFANKYHDVFHQASSSMHMIQSRHHLLVQQISEKIESLLLQFEHQDKLYLANILTECVLTCALQESISANDFVNMIHLIFRKEGSYYEQF